MNLSGFDGLASSTRRNFIELSVELPQNRDLNRQCFDNEVLQEVDQTGSNMQMLFDQKGQTNIEREIAIQMHESINAYLIGMSNAIQSAVSTWLRNVRINGVIVNGSVGQLNAGCIRGPDLSTLVYEGAPKNSKFERKYSRAVAHSIGNAWTRWQSSLFGTIIFPGLEAYAGPYVAGSKCAPVSFTVLNSVGEKTLTIDSLFLSMRKYLEDDQAALSVPLFLSISRAFNQEFLSFKNRCYITNLLATGPVPSFSLPLMTPGPVVAGTAHGAPGCLKYI